MDHNPPDDASQHAPASEHAELISNLSTMPNISQQNDPNFDQVPNQLEPNAAPTVREHEYPVYSQRIVNHRSQSSDQGVNPPSSHFSAPPHLNQSHHPQQRRENQPVLNPTKALKPGRLSCFDEEWQRTFKEDQEKREYQYQNHVLLNQDNEPLLSQNYEPLLSQHHQPLPSENQQQGYEIIYSQNQPLISQNSVPEHDQTRSQDYELLLSQHSQINQELHSIDESNEEGKSQIVSNEVIFEHFQPIKELVFNEESRSECSQRQQLSQPLFQMKINDESQSNLLKFGFSVSKKGRNMHEGDNNFNDTHQSVVPSPEETDINQIVKIQIPMDIQKYPHEGDSHSSIFHQGNQSNDLRQEEDNIHLLVKVQIPMDIESYPINLIPDSRDQTSNIFSQDRIIKIQVNDCPSQNINSVSKNNDIYGLNPQQSSHEKSNPSKQQEDINQPPELTMEPPQNIQVPQQDWTKIDQKQEQIKQQNSIVIQQQEKEVVTHDVNNLLNKCLQAIADYVPNLPEQHPLSLDEIAKQMDEIVNSDNSGQQKTQKGSKLLKEHIDLWFITPISEIGQQIMSNGETVVNLIKIMLAKQTDNALKEVLQKYLLLTFAKKVSKNQLALFEYQQSIAPVINQRMASNAGHVIPSQSQPQNEPSIIIHETQPSQQQIANESIHAQNGSSSKKYAAQEMDIVGQKEPIKRTVRTKNIISVHPTPQSGKVTRKGRPKVKTSAKKSVVKFNDEANQAQEPIKEQPGSPERKSRKKGNSKSVGKRAASKKKGQSQEQNEIVHLGSKFTYVLRENNRSHEKELVQKRVSQRLAGKQQARKSTSKSNQRKSSLRKRSSKKKYEEEELDLDFIKQNCHEIKVITALREDEFEALNQTDKEIYDLFRQGLEIQAEEEEYSRSHQSQNQETHNANNAQVQDLTVLSVHSVHSVHSQTSLMARKLQFKKNLAKYKVGEIPVIIERVVDPDINDHGIYALLELGKLSRFVHNARFALTPITSLSRALKASIDLDYEQAKRQVGDAQKNNLVYIQPNATILDMIKAEKEKRARARVA